MTKTQTFEDMTRMLGDVIERDEVCPVCKEVLVERLIEEVRELRIGLNKKNILIYKVEIDNYNMAIDDVIALLKKL